MVLPEIKAKMRATYALLLTVGVLGKAVMIVLIGTARFLCKAIVKAVVERAR